MFEALLFDFDGVIVDTEMPLFEAWRNVYREHGADLPIGFWISLLGKPGDTVNLCEKLELELATNLDHDEVRAKYHRYAYPGMDELPAMPGVVELIDEARARGLKLAVVSGSSRKWVGGHLDRLGITERFDVLVTREDTERHKPGPEPYLAAAEKLGVDPGSALVIEDAPNGVAAGVAAGMYVVAAHTQMTANLEMPGPHLRVETLAGLGLDQLYGRVVHGGPASRPIRPVDAGVGDV